jgi:hypothetical protein
MWFPALLDIPLQCISVLINRKIPLLTEFMSGADETKPFSLFERLIYSLLLFLFLIIVLVVIALFIYGIFMINDHFEGKRKEKRDATYKLVEEQSQIFLNRLDEDGKLIKHSEKTLDIKDLWGMPLHIEYNESLTEQKVTVRSSSFDKKIQTLDDITVTHRLPRKKGDIAKDVLGHAKDLLIKKLKKD